MSEFWSSLLHSPKDWVIGGVMAFVIWAIADLLPVGDSRIRGLVRWVRNKISEQSVARLQKRIKELEKARDSMKLMMSSDKPLYLTTVRTILGTLIFICVGCILLTLRHSEMLAQAAALNPEASREPLALLDMGSILMFTLGIAVAISGVSTAQLDTRSKIAEQVSKYEKDIESLNGILNERTAGSSPGLRPDSE
jgi:hypothetical protein